MNKRTKRNDFQKIDQGFFGRKNRRIAVLVWLNDPGCYFLFKSTEGFDKADQSIHLTMAEGLNEAQSWIDMEAV